MFYVPTRATARHATTRPITFVFNGGPGASSAYLHLGALGPRIVEFGADGQMPAPPAHLIDNPDNWLDLTDLVFVDPVGTGYSRTGRGEKPASATTACARTCRPSPPSSTSISTAPAAQLRPSIWSARATAAFARRACRRFWPTTTASAIAGVFLISPVLEFSLLSGDEFEPLPYVLRLPSYAAVRRRADGTR